MDPPAAECALYPNLKYYIQAALSDEAAALIAVDWWERHPFQNPVDVCNIMANIQVDPEGTRYIIDPCNLCMQPFISGNLCTST